MLKKTTSQAIITPDTFHELARPIIGMSVSRAWRGYGSAIFLEIGKLTRETRRLKDGQELLIVRGQYGIMLEWSWRVERPKSIYFGSWSTDRIINNRLSGLKGKTILAIETEGRLPELIVQLSEGLWVHSFETSEGQPGWCLFLDRKRSPHEWLKSERGRLLKETKLL